MAFRFHWILGIALSFTLISPVLAADEPTTGRCAILLHGLGRTGRSMDKLASVLKQENYLVWNQTYPSTQEGIEELSGQIETAMRFCRERGAERMYFVTHSLGGLLVRFYFQHKIEDSVRAVVMLAPPNHGSEVADRYHSAWWFQAALGPAGQQLGTEPSSFPNRLGPLTAPVGVIAGTESSDPWFSDLFTGPHDGKVSVESAKLPEMKDFLTVPAGHTFIMTSDEVVRQTLYFFDHLKFQRE